jgi:hypothetical protein
MSQAVSRLLRRGAETAGRARELDPASQMALRIPEREPRVVTRRGLVENHHRVLAYHELAACMSIGGA